MTAAYGEIGRRKSGQGGQARAGYGQALILRLAADLTRGFGRGFGKANLASMRVLYLAWPEVEIFQTVSGKSDAADSVRTPSGAALSGQVDTRSHMARAAEGERVRMRSRNRDRSKRRVSPALARQIWASSKCMTRLL
jgi:hypothetical protein